MADIALQIDDALLERLRTRARVRRCTLEQLITQTLNELAPPLVSAPDAIGAAPTHWNQEEAAFLHEAVRALDEVPGGSVLAASEAEWEKPD